MRFVSRFLVITFLVACMIPCSGQEDPVSVYRQLEREFALIPDGDTMTQSSQHLQRMAEAARALFSLDQAGVSFQAESVYFAQQPEGYVCQLLFADDTAHTTEFPLQQKKLPLRPGEALQIRLVGNAVASWPDLLVADPAEMHGASYAVNICHPDAAGRFVPQLRRLDRDQILFTIVKEDGDLFFRKYVWVLTPVIPDGKP